MFLKKDYGINAKRLNSLFLQNKTESEMELTAYIKDLCKKGESTEVEFKSAAGGFPGSFWETYSAFGNTNGGFIVLGIKEKNQDIFKILKECI